MRCLILVIFGLGVCMLQLRYVVSVSHTGLPAASGETEMTTMMMTEPDECEHKGCDCNCNCASPVCIIKYKKQCTTLTDTICVRGTETICEEATDEQCNKLVDGEKTCCLYLNAWGNQCWAEAEGREKCWDQPSEKCMEFHREACWREPSLECNIITTQKDIEFDPGYGHTTTYGGYSGGYSRPKCINRDCECECNCLHEAIPYNFQYTGQQKNAAPIAHINPAQLKVELFSQVVLDASQSFDPEGGPLKFLWILPSVGGIDLDPDFPEKFSFVATAEGEFTISLTVTDISGATDTAEAILAVFGPPPK